MSLTNYEKHIVKCPHCDKDVLDHMRECPFCKGELVPKGYKGKGKYEYGNAKKILNIAFWVIAAVLIAVILISRNAS